MSSLWGWTLAEHGPCSLRSLQPWEENQAQHPWVFHRENTSERQELWEGFWHWGSNARIVKTEGMGAPAGSGAGHGEETSQPGAVECGELGEGQIVMLGVGESLLLLPEGLCMRRAPGPGGASPAVPGSLHHPLPPVQSKRCWISTSSWQGHPSLTYCFPAPLFSFHLLSALLLTLQWSPVHSQDEESAFFHPVTLPAYP